MRNSVIRYLEETAGSFSDKAAVIDRDGSMTFEELRNEALKIGRAVSGKLGASRKPVFVYLPKSRQMVSAFMGILYSGNFYTPTDVNFPFEKVKGVLDVLEPALIITDGKYRERLLAHGVEECRILNMDKMELEKEGPLYSDRTIDTDAAYVLFTSGSTGVPKGVIISHRSIMDYIDWARECYGITEKSIIGNQAPFYFDNSTLDLYLMLSSGATLHIIPEQYYSFPARLMTYVKENRINTIFWVPSVFINVANADILSRIDCSCLKTILFAGEVMPNRHLNYWRRYLPDALYSNLYGPTEITVDCTYYIVDRNFRDDEPLPVGVPCPNTDILILDKGRLVTEPGKMGELCVRGTSLALGYWKNPEKTAEVFIQNPLNDGYGEKIYCTGDLVHYNERGEIMFDGRKDFQIKHMGYRIEPGEIENAALGLKEIREACVLYDTEEKELVLFYVADREADSDTVRARLAEKIPKYMVPAVCRRLDRFPCNDNGKIDRKRLSQYLADKQR